MLNANIMALGLIDHKGCWTYLEALLGAVNTVVPPKGTPIKTSNEFQ
ncbi:hypothetical protein K3495_g2247 [Podosphaera aphanis]|nr:hypothetical protein K3495_g2247 [Podosphaera aphanis]